MDINQNYDILSREYVIKLKVTSQNYDIKTMTTQNYELLSQL